VVCFSFFPFLGLVGASECPRLRLGLPIERKKRKKNLAKKLRKIYKRTS
jgi:hypothetical protein